MATTPRTSSHESMPSHSDTSPCELLVASKMLPLDERLKQLPADRPEQADVVVAGEQLVLEQGDERIRQQQRDEQAAEDGEAERPRPPVAVGPQLPQRARARGRASSPWRARSRPCTPPRRPTPPGCDEATRRARTRPAATGWRCCRADVAVEGHGQRAQRTGEHGHRRPPPSRARSAGRARRAGRHEIEVRQQHQRPDRHHRVAAPSRRPR